MIHVVGGVGQTFRCQRVRQIAHPIKSKITRPLQRFFYNMELKYGAWFGAYLG
jgi:hypothetical protein